MSKSGSSDRVLGVLATRSPTLADLRETPQRRGDRGASGKRPRLTHRTARSRSRLVGRVSNPAATPTVPPPRPPSITQLRHRGFVAVGGGTLAVCVSAHSLRTTPATAKRHTPGVPEAGTKGSCTTETRPFTTLRPPLLRGNSL